MKWIVMCELQDENMNIALLVIFVNARFRRSKNFRSIYWDMYDTSVRYAQNGLFPRNLYIFMISVFK